MSTLRESAVRSTFETSSAADHRNVLLKLLENNRRATKKNFAAARQETEARRANQRRFVAEEIDIRASVGAFDTAASAQQQAPNAKPAFTDAQVAALKSMFEGGWPRLGASLAGRSPKALESLVRGMNRVVAATDEQLAAVLPEGWSLAKLRALAKGWGRSIELAIAKRNDPNAAKPAPDAAAAADAAWREEFKTERAEVTADTLPLNVWHGSGENAKLSNLSLRPFSLGGRKFFSVEHAYQTLKSGSFDESTYRAYTGRDGQKIRGTKSAKTEKGKDAQGKPTGASYNVKLMYHLVLTSFQQNPEAAAALLETGERPITHIQDRGVWRNVFPRILTAVRTKLREEQETQDSAEAAKINAENAENVQKEAAKPAASKNKPAPVAGAPDNQPVGAGGNADKIRKAAQQLLRVSATEWPKRLQQASSEGLAALAELVSSPAETFAVEGLSDERLATRRKNLVLHAAHVLATRGGARLRDLPMNFADGTRGLAMRPEFRGKSTIDLIREGKRTATTRAERPDVREGDILLFRGGDASVVVARATKAPYQLPAGKDEAHRARLAERWSQLEGWAPGMYDRYINAWQFQYERFVPGAGAAAKPAVAEPRTPVQASQDALSGHVLHSGGAAGSDTMWGRIGAEYGLTDARHYYHGRKTPNGNVAISEQDYRDGVEAVNKANKTLKRQPAKFMSLLARNWQQVKNADAVFAIGTIENGVVKGGTGWAAQMAIDSGKPLFVFDQSANAWFKWEAGRFARTETPTLTKNFAGIGTREINANGLRAIRAAVEKTAGGTQATGAKPEAQAPQPSSPARIAQQLRALSRFTEEQVDAYTRLIDTFYQTLAQRTGIPVATLWEKYPLSVGSANAEGMGQAAALAAFPPEGWQHVTAPDGAVPLWNGTTDTKAVFWTDLQGKLAQDAPELAGYSHSIDRSSLNHIRKQHGDAASEALRGQVAVTEADIARIPEIITQPDAMRTGMKTMQGAQRVAYAKRVEDGVVVYVEDASRKKRDLHGVTMWKFSASSDVNTVLERVLKEEALIDKARARKTAGSRSARPTSSDYESDVLATPTDKIVADDDTFEQRAWHGSEADFDEFDLAHMGTGEGSQSYGWGAYATSLREVADYYRTVRSNRYKTPDGTEYYTDPLFDEWHVVDTSGKSREASATERLAANARLMAGPDKGKIAKLVAAWSARYTPADRAKIEALAQSLTDAPRGAVYEVEIPDDADLLQFDKRLDAHSPQVLAKLRGMEGFDPALKGSDFYSRLAIRLHSDKAASKLLIQHGIPGHKYTGGSGGANFVLYDDKVIQIVQKYKQQRDKALLGAFDPGALSIQLLEGANLSTFLHESGHFFLDMYEKLIAAHPQASVLRDDFNTLLAWMGHKGDFAAWQQLPRTEKRRMHERFARGFEAYLREGKAPSEKLKGIFAQFKEWLTRVYRSLTDLGVSLTPEVRGVMDRMLSGEQAPAAATATKNTPAPQPTPPARLASLLKTVAENVKAGKYTPFTGRAREELRAHYASQLAIPQEGQRVKIYAKDGALLADGYDRVVIGDYGAYMEIDPKDFHMGAAQVKPGEEYRIRDPNYKDKVKYDWYETKGTKAKVYVQKKGVSYADYKPGKIYLSPEDVTLENSAANVNIAAEEQATDKPAPLSKRIEAVRDVVLNDNYKRLDTSAKVLAFARTARRVLARLEAQSRRDALAEADEDLYYELDRMFEPDPLTGRPEMDWQMLLNELQDTETVTDDMRDELMRIVTGREPGETRYSERSALPEAENEDELIVDIEDAQTIDELETLVDSPYFKAEAQAALLKRLDDTSAPPSGSVYDRFNLLTHMLLSDAVSARTADQFARALKDAYDAVNEETGSHVDEDFNQEPTDDDRAVWGRNTLVHQHIRTSQSKSLLRALARAPLFIDTVLQNVNTPVDVLAALATDSNEYVRGKVVLHPNTPQEVRERLKHDKSSHVRAYAGEGLDSGNVDWDDIPFSETEKRTRAAARARQPREANGRFAPTPAPRSTVAGIRAELLKTRPWASSLEKRGLLQIVDTPAAAAALLGVPVNARLANTQGFLARDGRVVLIAANIDPGSAESVLLHEGLHLLIRRAKGTDEHKRMLSQFGRIHDTLGHTKWVKEALARVNPKDRGNRNVMLEEMAAYAIEQYLDEARGPRSLPLRVLQWTSVAFDWARAVLRKLGIPVGALSPRELAAMVAAGLR